MSVYDTSEVLKYRARDIIGMTIEEVWELPDEDILLSFDDGDIITGMRETIYSRYIWEIHARYPSTPILKQHHIQDELVTPTMHLKLGAAAIFDCRKAYNNRVDMEVLSKIMYELFNRLYNDTIIRLPEYVGTVNVLDFIEIQKQAEIEEANNRLKLMDKVKSSDINQTYVDIKRTIMENPALDDNNIVKALRSTVLKIDQVMQCVGPRGFVSDADSHIYPVPILSGYLKGHTRLVDSMKDSRSAVIALYNQKDPMRLSETFNRMLQLSTDNIQRMHMYYEGGISEFEYLTDDCKSQDYIPWTIKDSQTLGDSLGKWFLNMSTGELEVITKDRKDLIGRTVQMRSSLRCKIADREGVCLKCAGDALIGLPANTNLGHASCTTMQEKSTQNLLSTKHHLQSMVAEMFSISAGDRNYISNINGTNMLRVAAEMRGRSYKIHIPEQALPSIQDLLYVEDVSGLSPVRLSEIEYIRFASYDKRGEMLGLTDVRVSIATRRSSFTIDMLKYIKVMGWTVDDAGNYVIDMTNWDVNLPFLVMPLKQFSMPDYISWIRTWLSGGTAKRGMETIRNCKSHEEALNKFYDMVSLKLRVNISHLEIILLSLMVEDIERRDYRLPLDKGNGQIALYKDTIQYRSMAPMLAYQDQHDILFAPTSALITQRPPHPLDPLPFG